MMNYIPKWRRLALSCLLLCGGLSLFAQPVNDLCDDATELTVQMQESAVFVTATNADATASGTSPEVTCVTDGDGQDVWFSFTATAAAIDLEVQTVDGGPTDLAMILYSGTCADLTQIECDDDEGDAPNGLQPIIRRDDYVVGDVYYLRITEFQGNDFGEFSIAAYEPTPPPPAPDNDECVDATELPIQFEGFADLDTFTVTSSTPSGIANPTCGFLNGGNDVFFTVTATSDTLIVEVADGGPGSNDLAMTAYSGDCAALTQIECDDDDGPGSFPRLELGGLTPGDVITFRVYDFGGSDDGDFSIIAVEPAPAAIVLDCPTDTVLLVGDDCTVALPDFTLEVEADDDEATLTQDSLAGSPVGLVDDAASTFDLTVTAESPNNPATSTCVISVTVADSTAPVITCADATVSLDDTGVASMDSMMLADAILAGGATDNCMGDVTFSQVGDFNLTCTAVDMNTGDMLDNTATFVATDASGNTDTCTVTVTVEDPSNFCGGTLFFDCPTEQDTVVVGDDCMAIVADYSEDVTTNAQIVTQTPPAGSEVTVGDTMVVVVYELGDMIDSCVIDLTVEDTISPMAVCADVTVFLDEQGTAEVSLEPLMEQDMEDDMDAPTPVTQISGTLEEGVSPEFERPDGNGDDCTVNTGTPDHLYDVFEFEIDQADTYSFVMQPEPDDDFYFLMYDGPFDPDNPCENHIGGDDDDAGSADPELMIMLDLVPGEYTLVITEFSSFTGIDDGAYVVDISSENGGAVLARSAQDDDEDASEVATLDGGSTDNCSPLTFTADVTTFSCDDLGENTVTLTVTDPSGNSAICTSTVTVADTIAPVITVEDGELTIDVDGNAQLDIADVAAATDNCTAVPTITLDRLEAFSCADIGLQLVEVTATDESGNASVDTVNVNVDFEQPLLACIDRINVDLNDDCQHLLIPSQVLTGNTACLDVLPLEIVVLDSDTTNGPIIDGCGEYTYIIREPLMTSDPVEGFTGEFAEDNFVIDDAPGGTATFTDTELTLTTGADEGVSASYTFMDAGEVSFTVDYFLESDIIADILIIDFDGNVIFETIDDSDGADTDLPVEGSEDVVQMVSVGSTLLIDLQGDDFATGGVTSTVTVSDFLFQGPDTEILDFDQCWGTVIAKDGNPPVLVSTPEDVTGLLCVDLDANDVNSLPASVSKCFLVDNGGDLIESSIDPALLAILSPAAFDNDDEDVALIPVFTDNCASTIEVCVADVVTQLPDAEGRANCGELVITRTFRANEADACAADYNGVTDEDELVTSFTITLTRPTIDQITTEAIMPVVEIETCAGEDAQLTFLPGEDDFPVITIPSDDPDGEDRVFAVNSPEAMCANLVTTFTNSANPTQVCANTVKFTRLYSVADWCNPTQVRNFTQFVKVGDSTGPVFSRPSGTIDQNGNLDPVLTYRTNFGDECAAIVRLDGPGVGALDECDGSEVQISVAIYPEGDQTQSPFGAYPVLLNNGEAEFSDPLEVGEYSFFYTAIDQCGNRTVTEVEFIVVDGNGPTAICESGVVVALSRPGGVGVLTPEQIDLGSYDDCSDNLTLQIGRSDSEDVMPTEFGDEVVFTCDDANTIRYVTLQVTDELENVNTCWLPVEVNLEPGQSSAPICNAPSDVTLTCSQYTTMLPADIMEATQEELNAAFGVATGSGTCGVDVTGTFDPATNFLNECGIGTIERTYVATDREGVSSTNTCVQTITVVGVFDYQIVLPGNAVSNDCNDEFEADELEITGGACDMPVVTSTVERIDGEPGTQCYIERITYNIINTCEYDPTAIGSTVITRDGIAAGDDSPLYLTLLPGSTNTDLDDRAFVSSSANRQLTPGDDDDVELFNYSTSPVRGNFTYVQDIRVNDRVSPELSVPAQSTEFVGNCTADVVLTFNASDDCVTPTTTVEIDPFYDQGAGFEPVPPADLGVGVSVTAGAEEDAFVVTATNVPAGEHAARLTVTDDCGNSRSTIVPFEVTAGQAPSILCETGIIAVLTDDGAGGGMSEVWAVDLVASPVIDCFGNEVTYGISRFGEVPASRTDSGLVVTCADFGQTVIVEVYAFDDAGNTPEFCTTEIEIQEGDDVDCFSGGNLVGTILTGDGAPMGDVAVTLTGTDDMDVMDMTDASGTFEFVNLPLGGDYTLQPDYNEPVNLQQVKISDVVKISSVILGTSTFESPYDFLAADVDQSSSLNVLDMVAIQRVILGLDDIFRTNEAWGFVPANVDVSDPYTTAFPNVLNANDFQANILDADFVAFAYGNVVGEGRTASTITVEDVQFAAGQTHTITIAADELQAFQGTFELGAGLELLDVSYEGEGALNLNYVAEGLVAAALRGDAVLNLEVRATEADRLSNLLSLTNAITVAEGVRTNGNNGSLSLAFGTLTAANLANALGNATPNPVVEQTQIDYTLAQAGKVTLSIQDVQGRTVLVRNLEGVQGRNLVNLTVADLGGAAGVLTYTLTAGDFSATKKLVVAR